jgi:hypothetical protein
MQCLGNVAWDSIWHLFAVRFQFSWQRRIVDWVGVFEMTGPEPPSPRDREFFGEILAIEPQSSARPAGIRYLQMSQFMQEDFVQHEPPDGECRPLRPPLRTEFRWRKCVQSAESA